MLEMRDITSSMALLSQCWPFSSDGAANVVANILTPFLVFLMCILILAAQASADAAYTFTRATL